MKSLVLGRAQTPQLVIGIDLGTTNSLLAIAGLPAARALPWAGEGQAIPAGSLSERVPVELLSLPQTDLDGTQTEEILFPSAVYIDQQGQRFVGAGAKEARFTQGRGRRVFYSVKKDLGTSRDPFYLGAATPDLNTPIKVSAVILRAMKEAAEVKLGRLLDGVPTVITVPASFGPPQRRDTLQAATLAGLTVAEEGLFDEPNAALLGYINRNQVQSRWSPEESVLIFDFGGGTCDISIVDLSFSPVSKAIQLRSRAISRFEMLGGDDIDQHLVHTHLKNVFYEATGTKEQDWGFAERRDSIWSQLARCAELLKRRICEELDRVAQRYGWHESLFDHVQVALTPQVIDTTRGLVVLDHLSLDYKTFRGVMVPFLDAENLGSDDCEFYRITSIFSPIYDALDKAQMEPSDITRVLLVGGSSSNPAVQAALTAFFKHAGVDRTKGMDTLVAEGAALHAFYHYHRGQNVLAPIVGDTIGLQLEGGDFAPLIAAGQPIPYPEDRGFVLYTHFRTPRAGMKRIDLVICAGSADRPVQTVHLNTARPLPQSAPLHLKIRLDGNKIFHMEAYLPDDPASRVTTQIENPLALMPLTALQQRRIDLEQTIGEAGLAGALDAHVDDMVNLASVLIDLDRPEQGAEWIDQAIRRSRQTNDRMRAIKALGLFGMGNLAGAHRLYADLARRQDGFHYMAGLTAPDIPTKERCMRQAVVSRPKDGVSHYGLGIVSMEKGDFAGASAAFEQSAALLQERHRAFPRDTTTMSFLASVYAYLGREVDATEMLRRRDSTVAEAPHEMDNRPAIVSALTRRV